MRQVLCLMLVWFFVLKVSANENRSTIKLKDYEWSIVDEQTILENANNSEEIFAAAKSLTDFDSINQNNFFVTSIDIDQTGFKLASLYLYADDDLFSVFINGDELKNELNDGNFHAEITQYAEMGQLLLELKPKEKVSTAYFNKIIANAQIALMRGVFVCHFSSKVDTFFGGKLLEVDIRNFLNSDVDGKVYARLYDKETWKLIAENNNCAFTRSGVETMIEVNFPDLDESFYGKTYLAEVEIVDKENNESVVDTLTLPLQF